MTVPFIVMLSGAKHLRDSSGLASLRMTVPFMVMLSESETSQRFFGTIVPQNDKEERMSSLERAVSE